MLVEKLVKMVSQLVMLILLARYLGPESVGQLMYCFAIASIFIFLSGLGLDTLLIKVFINLPDKAHSYLKHALIARVLAGFICVFLINTVSFFLVDSESRFIIFFISLYHLFMPLTVYEWYYQAIGRGELSAAGLIIGHISGFVFRCVCLYLGKDLVWLGAAYTFEAFVMAVSFRFIAKKQKLKAGGYVSKERMLNLVRTSYPLIISSAIVILYMKVDQLMLGYIIDNQEVGIYVAATRLSEAWYIIGITLVGSYFPKLLHVLKDKGDDVFYMEIIRMAKPLIWCAILLALVVTSISEILIQFIYGSEFTRSAQVLLITIWAVPFVYVGTISTKIYINNSQAHLVLYRSVTGLFLNVLLNLFLINRFGALGAAIGTLVAQIGACYLFNLCTKDKTVFFLQTDILIGTSLIKR